MSHNDFQLLQRMARRYVWWKRPDDAVSDPLRVVAQVMNLGDWDDVRTLQRRLGDDTLRAALQHAEAGQFNARSWSWWHYRLGLATLGQVPPLPARRFE